MSRGAVLLALAALWAHSAVQAQSFTLTPASGPGPFTATWSVPNGTACAGSGEGFTGAQAASGSKAVQPTRVGVASYSLACSVPGPAGKGSVTLTCTPATQNTDGSAYTDPKAIAIYSGKGAGAPANRVATIDQPGPCVKLLDQLDPVLWTFGAQSVNSKDVSSDMSALLSVTIDGSTTVPWTQTRTVTVIGPGPPAGITVKQVQAYRLDQSTKDDLRLVQVGTVPLGVACKPADTANGLYLVPVARVKFSSSLKKPYPLVVLARCG